MSTVTDLGPIVMMSCDCKQWPIFTLWKIGRCGLCGVRPEIKK